MRDAPTHPHGGGRATAAWACTHRISSGILWAALASRERAKASKIRCAVSVPAFCQPAVPQPLCKAVAPPCMSVQQPVAMTSNGRPPLLLAKSAKLQDPASKEFVQGTLSLYSTKITWKPASPAASLQELHLGLLAITGAYAPSGALRARPWGP